MWNDINNLLICWNYVELYKKVVEKRQVPIFLRMETCGNFFSKENYRRLSKLAAPIDRAQG